MVASHNDLLAADDNFWLPELYGYERGYNANADVIVQSADGADLNRMWREFQRTLTIFNRERDVLLNWLTFDVTNPAERVMQPSTEDFVDATEYGEPTGVRIGKPFNLGYGFKWSDIAARFTWMFLLESSREQIEAVNKTVLDAGRRLYFKEVLKALLNNVNRVATINEQAVNVYPLYNADGTVPPTFETDSFAGSHTHYLTTNNTPMVPADLTDMEDHLYHHGYRFELGYEYVLVVNRQEGSVIRGFKTTGGAPYDFIPNPSFIAGGMILPQNGGIIGQPDMNLPQQIGTYGPWKVVQMSVMPAGYMLGFASGGEQNIGNLVGIRQHDNPAGRGLQLVQGPRDSYPLVDSFYRFGFGTGVRHRGAGVVMQVKVGATYDIPAAYV